MMDDSQQLSTPQNKHHGGGAQNPTDKDLKTWFIGSIDQGTTSTRFTVFDDSGHPVASHQIELNQIYPHPGCVASPPELPFRSGS